MGQAFDRDGNVLGGAEADTAREVLEQLQLKHKGAAEFRIQVQERLNAEEQKIKQAAEQNRAGVPATESMPRDRMLQFFTHAHLPDHLARVSLPFCQLAEEIAATLPSNPERTVALRKLLEAKDCAVRALLFK
jgi:hypothetical protein